MTEETEADRQERLREQAEEIRRTPTWPSYDHATEQALVEELMGKAPKARPSTAKRQAAKPKAAGR